ncbi:sensor histidine kinase [Gracilimonas halophila]|uniref:histidine kinase n=1 Tax=Gracilimonas halophila TaxID=1834464 RepID=A0ABW5JEW9_9BACT
MSSAILKSPIQNKTWLLTLLLTLLALGYGLFEIWAEHSGPDESQKAVLANESINSALQQYSKFEADFLFQSNKFYESAKQQLEEGADLEFLTEVATKNHDFWGMSLFKDQELILWTDFGARNLPLNSDKIESGPFLTIDRENNVTFLSYRASLVIEDSDSASSYVLLTRKKIQQENILPIGNASELSPSNLFQIGYSYPVRFSFFEPPPQNPQFSSTLSTHSVDSVGVLYTLEEDFATYQNSKQNQFFIYRAIFYALLISLIALFLISFSRELSTWNSLFLKLFALISAWLFFSNIEYGVGWIELFSTIGGDDTFALTLLIRYCIHAVFIFLITLVCLKPLSSAKLNLEETSIIILPVINFFFGLLSSFLIFFFLTETYSLFLQSSIPVLDLEIFPGWLTLLFYVASGVFTISAITLLTLLGRFLLDLSQKLYFIPLGVMSLGFISGLLMVIGFKLYPAYSGWILLGAIFFFILILVSILLAFRRPKVISEGSRLRLFLLYSFIAVCISYVAVYQGYSDRLNDQMNQAAQLFIDEEATEAERIVRDLLTSLEQSVSVISAQDLTERPAFVANLFTQQTQRLISEEWERFSISTQLVNNEGEIIGEYSSNLDSPAWTRAFNMRSLVIPFQEEQIRINNLRPIVRERPLNEANSNYSSFRRAWIPLYERGNSNLRIGWILCSVYRERPQFEKPLRAVIAYESTKNWNASISITEYIDGRSARRNVVGPPLELPGYVQLSENLKEQIQRDSVVFRVSGNEQEQVRELFIATSNEQIIRAATKNPRIDNHLFSVLRFFFTVLIAGLFVLGTVFWKSDIHILGHNRRFRDRLIDRFIFASLICLMALITTTYYAIKDQNQKSVQDQLLSKLDNLTEAVSEFELQSSGGEQIPLNQLTSTLDADASLYKNKLVDISTTGQIYSQHLIPRLIPWSVYESIYFKGNAQVTRKVVLGDQQLLIGYQPWIDKDSKIAGVVSIPTFLEAPKFIEQVLSTTSFLLGLYVIIFGLFILGAALISTQLTTPLEALREGLKKISGGDLETTLPVKSQDEIGSLTNAYNVMVYRLKDLQNDLAKAEREAAWKEMAQQVAHEIKNPLTPMKLNLQHLERQLKTSGEDFNELKPNIEKIAANMIGQIESLNRIASDFSKFARPTEQEFSPVEMNGLLTSIAELYAAEESVTIKTQLFGEELWVQGAEDELRRVFVNLVKNALEAINNEGRITLSSELDKDRNSIFIHVEDNGSGIPEESRDQIFVPNFSTKSSGTGLGLAITKKIIGEHEGSISFTSKAGEGTIFTIELPHKE